MNSRNEDFPAEHCPEHHTVIHSEFWHLSVTHITIFSNLCYTRSTVALHCTSLVNTKSSQTQSCSRNADKRHPVSSDKEMIFAFKGLQITLNLFWSNCPTNEIPQIFTDGPFCQKAIALSQQKSFLMLKNRAPGSALRSVWDLRVDAHQPLKDERRNQLWKLLSSLSPL